MEVLNNMAKRPQSRISINIHGQNVVSEAALMDFLYKLNPVSVLVMDNEALARRILAMLPDCIVIHRNYGITSSDEDLHRRMSPERWLELRARESTEGGLWLYVQNEPPFDKDCLEWHVRLMNLAVQRGVKLVVGNWSVGTPKPEDWVLARAFLHLCAAYPEYLITGLHEYGGGVLTSGLYGGYPDHAGVQPGEDGGVNLVNPDNWPIDVGTMGQPGSITTFHAGRFRFLLNYCKQAGIDPPRIIITEHGIDDLGDIGAWLHKLEVAPGYGSIRGWKTLTSQWSKWWQFARGWTAERAYFEQLAWADKAIYTGSPVIAQLIYCYGHSSEAWQQFDIADAGELQRLLVDRVASSQPIPVSPPPVEVPTAQFYLKIPLAGAPDSVVNFLKSAKLTVEVCESENS